MNKKNKKKINTSKVVIILSLLLIIVICLYAGLNSEILNSKNIEIKGNNYVKDDDVIKTLDIRYDKNIFRYNTKSMEEILLRNRYIDKVEIKRKLPNTLNINIVEKEIIANLYNGQIYCYIDSNGNFIDKFDKNNSYDSIITVNVDYTLIDSQYIKFNNEENRKRVTCLLEYIKEEGIYKKIDNIDMTNDNIINMYTKEKTTILLNSDEELKYNISRLAMILSDLQNRKQKGGEIDLSKGKYALYRP